MKTRDEYAAMAEALLASAETSAETTYEGHNPIADRDIAAAHVYATLATAAPVGPDPELVALRRAVAALLHDAATSPDSEAHSVLAQFRAGLPDTAHGEPVLALAAELMDAELDATG